jgi:16S rRNA (adenine1518-N6/adenine1519-N6)-dimethyltransferase
VLDEVLAGADPAPAVVHADALELDWPAVLDADDEWQLVANLPYNVATPLVLDVLDRVPAVTRMLVMVQREVAERLASGPGTKAYGIPSVKVAYWADAEIVGRVGPTVFLPQPRVESALVRIVRRTTPATDADPDALFALVRAGFGHRRKMLRGALAGLVDAEAFARAGISPESRAEELSVTDWGRLVQ